MISPRWEDPKNGDEEAREPFRDESEQQEEAPLSAREKGERIEAASSRFKEGYKKWREYYENYQREALAAIAKATKKVSGLEAAFPSMRGTLSGSIDNMRSSVEVTIPKALAMFRQCEEGCFATLEDFRQSPVTRTELEAYILSIDYYFQSLADSEPDWRYNLDHFKQHYDRMPDPEQAKKDPRAVLARMRGI